MPLPEIPPTSLSAQIIDIGDERMLGLCPDGRKVWLRGPAVPGDGVRFVEEGKAGVVTEILRPAPGRLTPPCPHFDTCPGCQLQPLPYDVQLALKSSKIRETLRRLGGFEDLDFQGVCPSPEPYGTRNKLDFTVEGPELGYQSAQGLVPIHDCRLGDPLLRAALPPLREWLRTHPTHALHRLILRVDGERKALHLLLRGELSPDLHSSLLEAARHIPALQSLSLQRDWKAPWTTLLGNPELRFRLADEEHVLRHDAFFQVHDRLADMLVRCAMDWLGEVPAGALLDLFCGAGAFTLPAARIATQVLGIDSHPGQGPFLAANLHHGLPRDPRVRKTRWNTLVTDPPRAGMSEGLIADILQLRPGRILYISCNPATLARDLRRLCANGAYTLQRVRGFDLFPQTTHVETLALLVKTP